MHKSIDTIFETETDKFCKLRIVKHKTGQA